jgi:hypothetical protein
VRRRPRRAAARRRQSRQRPRATPSTARTRPCTGWVCCAWTCTLGRRRGASTSVCF